MAKSQVTLTFAGDSKSLEKAFDRVGAGAKDMAADMDQAASKAKGLGSAVDRTGSVVGGTESKFMGTADVLDGLATTMGLNIDRQIELARGFGDMAGGIENLKGTLSSGVDGLQKMAGAVKDNASAYATKAANIAKAGAATAAHTIKTAAQTVATNAATIAQRAFNLAMTANPVLLVVTALAALATGLVIAYKKSETFRRIVDGAFGAVKDAAQGALDVVLGIVGAVKKVLEWLGILDRKGADSAKQFSAAMDDVQADARRGAQAAGAQVPGSFTGGRDLVRRHAGGIVPGPRGAPTPILALGGERVLPVGRSASPPAQRTLVVHVENLVVRETADLDRVAAGLSRKLSMAGVAA